MNTPTLPGFPVFKKGVGLILYFNGKLSVVTSIYVGLKNHPEARNITIFIPFTTMCWRRKTEVRPFILAMLPSEQITWLSFQTRWKDKVQGAGNILS